MKFGLSLNLLTKSVIGTYMSDGYQWILTVTGIAVDSREYRWEDDKVWGDTLIWTESL